jgi:hypothetical protein
MFLKDAVQAIFQFRHMTSQSGGLPCFSLAPGSFGQSLEKLIAAIEISNDVACGASHPGHGGDNKTPDQRHRG